MLFLPLFRGTSQRHFWVVSWNTGPMVVCSALAIPFCEGLYCCWRQCLQTDRLLPVGYSSRAFRNINIWLSIMVFTISQLFVLFGTVTTFWLLPDPRREILTHLFSCYGNLTFIFGQIFSFSCPLQQSRLCGTSLCMDRHMACTIWHRLMVHTCGSRTIANPLEKNTRGWAAP